MQMVQRYSQSFMEGPDVYCLHTNEPLDTGMKRLLVVYMNLYLTNGFSHHYQLDEYNFILGVLGAIVIFFI